MSVTITLKTVIIFIVDARVDRNHLNEQVFGIKQK